MNGIIDRSLVYIPNCCQFYLHIVRGWFYCWYFAQFRGWRCIHESECRALSAVHDPHAEGLPRIYWKLRDDGLCEPECPAGQMENRTDKHHCVRCVGKCPKGAS